VCKRRGETCCYTDYGCWNKGGICSANNPDVDDYIEFENNAWDCPSQMKCFVENENYFSYYEYITSYGGSGNIIIPTNIKPGETYAISFGSPTGNCELCTKLGLGVGVLTVGGAIALGIPTGGIGGIVVLFGAGYFAGKGGSEFTLDSFEDLFERDTNTMYITTLDQILSGDYCSIVEEC